MQFEFQQLKYIVRNYYHSLWPFAWFYEKPGLLSWIENIISRDTMSDDEQYGLIYYCFSKNMPNDEKPLAKIVRNYFSATEQILLKYLFKYEDSRNHSRDVLKKNIYFQLMHTNGFYLIDLKKLLDGLLPKDRSLEMIEALLICLNQGMDYDELRKLADYGILNHPTLKLICTSPTRNALLPSLFITAQAKKIPFNDWTDIAKADNPNEMLKAYDLMYQNKVTAHKDLIRQHKNPFSMAFAVGLLFNTPLLNNEMNRELLLRCNAPAELAHTLYALRSKNLLDRNAQAHLSEVLTASEGFHTYSCSVIGRLNEVNRYSKLHYKLAMSHKTPAIFALAIGTVNEKYLSDCILDIYKFETNCIFFADLIKDLYNYRLYDKPTIDLLLAHQHQLYCVPNSLQLLKEKNIPLSLAFLKCLFTVQEPRRFTEGVIILNQHFFDTPENLEILSLAKDPRCFANTMVSLSEQTDFPALQQALKNNLLQAKQKAEQTALKSAYSSKLLLFDATAAPTTTAVKPPLVRSNSVNF